MKANEVIEVLSSHQEANLPYCLTLVVASGYFDPSDLAYELQVSSKVLENWMLGRNLPKQEANKGILGSLIERLFEKIEGADKAK